MAGSVAVKASALNFYIAAHVTVAGHFDQQETDRAVTLGLQAEDTVVFEAAGKRQPQALLSRREASLDPLGSDRR